eukprot:363047-Chlamydomonas_euryale.AAC.5
MSQRAIRKIARPGWLWTHRPCQGPELITFSLASMSCAVLSYRRCGCHGVIWYVLGLEWDKTAVLPIQGCTHVKVPFQIKDSMAGRPTVTAACCNRLQGPCALIR